MEGWHNLLPVILTCPGNETRLNKLLAECQRVGISNVQLWDRKYNYRNRIARVFAGHYDIVRIAYEQSDKDVFIMEDDCQFLFDDAGQRILDAHAIAVKSNKWTVLFAGHIPAGPLWRRRDGLYTTSLPYAAHSYILNRKRVGRLLQTTPKSRWTRPWMGEGYLGVPVSEKLAVYPAITTQSFIPSDWTEYRFFKSLKDPSMGVWQAMVHDIWLRDIPVLVCMWLVLMCVVKSNHNRWS